MAKFHFPDSLIAFLIDAALVYAATSIVCYISKILATLRTLYEGAKMYETSKIY